MAAEHIIVDPHAGHRAEQSAEHAGEEPATAAAHHAAAVPAAAVTVTAAAHTGERTDDGEDDPYHKQAADNYAHPREKCGKPICPLMAIAAMMLDGDWRMVNLGLPLLSRCRHMLIHRVKRVIGDALQHLVWLLFGLDDLLQFLDVLRPKKPSSRVLLPTSMR